MVNQTTILSDFSASRNELISILIKKIVASKVTRLNFDIDSKYRPEVGYVQELLEVIEQKFKRCEQLHYTYFQQLDHQTVVGRTINLPISADFTFIDGVSTIQFSYAVDSQAAYKSLIDVNFQTYILTIASLYENLVMLAEIFLKKVMIYVRRPLSTPLHDYLKYWRMLIDLGYRGTDKLTSCIHSSNIYFDAYLNQINELRNRFIHGFSTNLETDGYNYYVTSNGGTFTPKSLDLQLDVFSNKILQETKIFILNLMAALGDTVKHHRKTIPG